MVKKTITYNDFEGNQVTKDFYFNISKMEFRELDRKIPGGIQSVYDRIYREKDKDLLIDLLNAIVLESYGEKLADGRFVKEDSEGRRLSSYFKVSDAWDVMFMNLINNDNELNAFLMGIVPKDLAESAKEAMANGELTPLPTA